MISKAAFSLATSVRRRARKAMAISPDGQVFVINTSRKHRNHGALQSDTSHPPEIVGNVPVSARPRPLCPNSSATGSELWVSSENPAACVESSIPPKRVFFFFVPAKITFCYPGLRPRKESSRSGIGQDQGNAKTALFFVALGPPTVLAVVLCPNHTVTKYLLVGQRGLAQMASRRTKKYLPGLDQWVSPTTYRFIDVSAPKVIKTIQGRRTAPGAIHEAQPMTATDQKPRSEIGAAPLPGSDPARCSSVCPIADAAFLWPRRALIDIKFSNIARACFPRLLGLQRLRQEHACSPGCTRCFRIRKEEKTGRISIFGMNISTLRQA